MKSRGLDHNRIQLGVMDGLSGLEKVFEEEFSNAKIQRCQVHVCRNVLVKTPRKMKAEVSDHLRDIFYATGKKKALEHYKTFFSFPREEWISLRTTNTIARVNKEFKRRTKPMEILAGEQSAYRLLCFIALKMELNWRSAPLGRNNLPALNKFTQLT